MDTNISSLDRDVDAELAFLGLVDHYDLDPDYILRSPEPEQGLDVSVPKVKYRDIAPKVNLRSELQGKDMPNFDIYRARILNSLFREIVSDIEVMMKQYGDPVYHANVEARSRFFAPVFNRVVSLFDMTIMNSAESIIPGRMTTKGRIVYYFSVFGQLSILVIEVKFSLGTADERFDAIAQVIAECDACSNENDRRGFPPSLVYGVLSDGTSFEFFAFDGSATPGPTFSRGILRSTPTSIPAQRLSVADYLASPIAFIGSLRPICEVLFSFFLLSYKTGISAYTEQRSFGGVSEERSRNSFPNWVEALYYADKALSSAKDAAAKAQAHDDANSMGEATEIALVHLRESLAFVPTTHKIEIDLLRLYDDMDFTYY